MSNKLPPEAIKLLNHIKELQSTQKTDWVITTDFNTSVATGINQYILGFFEKQLIELKLIEVKAIKGKPAYKIISNEE